MRAFTAFVTIGWMVSIIPVTRAMCLDRTACFCQLAPEECDVLITAEVVESEPGKTEIRITRIHQDPGGDLQTGQSLEFEPSGGVTPTPGSSGLFRIHVPNTCYDLPVEPNEERYVLPESDGRYLCMYDDDFEGATESEVVQAALSDDCRKAVEKLGVSNNCPSESGCCSQTTASTDGLLLLALFGTVLFSKNRSGNMDS